MANVFIKTAIKKKSKQFLVIEHKTELALKTYKTYDEARKFAKHQNNGGGFAGDTPMFMMNGLKK